MMTTQSPAQRINRSREQRQIPTTTNPRRHRHRLQKRRHTTEPIDRFGHLPAGVHKHVQPARLVIAKHQPRQTIQHRLPATHRVQPIVRQRDTPTANTTPIFIAHNTGRYRTIRSHRESIFAAVTCPVQRLALMLRPDNHSALAAQSPEPLGYRTTLGHRATIRFKPSSHPSNSTLLKPKGNNQGPFVFTENKDDTTPPTITTHPRTARQPYARNNSHRPTKKAPQGTTA